MEQPNSQITEISLDDFIQEIKQSRSKIECLKLVYNTLINRYHGERLYTITHLFKLFTTDIKQLWQSPGVMHCTNINRLFKFLLLQNDLFSKTDVESHWTLLWFFSPHQFLRVRTEFFTVKVDVWAKNFGIKFGDYAHGFHLKTQ